jgi:hypothetical protein
VLSRLGLLSLVLALLNPLCAQVLPPAFGHVTLLDVPGLPQTDSSSGEPGGYGDLSNWKTVAPDMLQDQKRIFRDFPRNLAHGKHWIPVAAFLGVTGLLIALDQYQAPYFRSTTTFRGFNTALSGALTHQKCYRRGVVAS